MGVQMAAKPLNELKIRTAKPAASVQKLFDGGGLYLEVRPNGAKYWRLKYRFGGKEKAISFGVYPDVGLAEARQRRDKARALLRDGLDPSAERKQQKRQARIEAINSFEAVAEQWLGKMAGQWKPGHLERVRESFKQDIYPSIGGMPISQVGFAEVRDVVRAVEQRGALDVAGRVKQRVAAVFQFAMEEELCSSNPARELRVTLKGRRVTHRHAIGREDLPTFLADLDCAPGTVETLAATKLLLLTFVRTGELREARWSEIDFDTSTWRIPAERMKMGQPHIVPLSTQAVAVFRELHEITGNGELVFRSPNKPRQALSENAVLFTLYRMGYRGRMTGHGFRALASTCLNEMGWSPDVIERQLAHIERNQVRAAYNRAQYLDDRRRMMQGWADYLDGVRAGGKVVPLQRKRLSKAG
ncbi:MAG: tyrosine-type recombinase/integrase [Dyella sp.]